MRLRSQVTIALLVVLTVVPCSGCAHYSNQAFIPLSTSFGPAIPAGFGVNIDFTDPRPGEMKMLAEAGVRWVRMDFKWDVTETAKGIYDFAAYDRLMAALAPFGIRALFILDYGNPLYDDGAPPRTEYTRQAFARWAVAAAKHYSGRGVIWETYNEPNNQMFWRPRPDVNEYAALALAVAHAFRTDVPNEKLVGPALGEMDFSFLEGCFKAGLLEYWAAVSVHPYLRSNPELVSGDYQHLRKMIESHSPRARQVAIFAGEWGYSSVWPGMNEEKQGQYLARQWLINAANDIPLSIWYDWHDDGLDPNEPEHHFGMVSNAYHEGRDPVYDPKPAYLAAKTLTAFLNGYRFEQRLEVGSVNDYVLAFRKGSEFRFAAWTTAGSSRNVRLPLSAGRYTGKRHDGQDLGVFNGDAKGLSITLTSAPQFLRSI